MRSAGEHSNIQSICFAGAMRSRAPYRGDDETSMPTASALAIGMVSSTRYRMQR
jgi:hypothetical protein